MMPRPRGGDWLNDEIKNIKTQGVTILTSLLEKDEIEELDLLDEKIICDSLGLEYLSFPIPDRNIPKNTAELDHFLTHVRTRLQEKNSIVIHCRMGIGRSSIIAAALILDEGLKPTELMDHISQVRGIKVPDTEEQLIWLKSRRKNERTT